MKLNYCNINLLRVDAQGNECHEYVRDSERFTGITGFIRNMLRPNEYNDIPEAILERARKKGDLVHRECELINSGIDVPEASVEANVYLDLITAAGLKPIESEYVVTDEDTFATSIDTVLEDEANGVVLGDYKTTYKLDIPYLTAQLNVMKYLFELQNPHLKVSKLIAFWLRPERGEMREIEMLDKAEVEQMLEAWKLGLTYDIPAAMQDVKPTPAELERYAAAIPILDETVNKLTAQLDNAKKAILSAMLEKGDAKWECGNAKFSVVKGTTRRSLDSKAVLEKFPTISKDETLWKSSVTKDSIRTSYSKSK